MENFLLNNQWIIWPALLWMLVWKGWSLWLAARRGEKIWYILLLVVNTLGLLEIIYILIVTKMGKSGPKPAVTQPTSSQQ